MARINESKFGETSFQKLLGHNKDVMDGWTKLGEVLEKNGKPSSQLKEQVRRTLAQSNGCEYCKAKGKPEPHLFNEKMSIAVGFTEVFAKQKGDISDATFNVLKDSDVEISELCAFITFTTASQYFGAILALEPALEGV
ncbi:carboxymuconolactone decarboxylase family protein [Peribacillus cavernae]|uniref:Carboxymuconolactone decarboxylase family protein n=1 Tax=Peribacillus cavernae TaxID=1674310 RepID=A0A3S0VFF4_9BACI|nr:carboxymuconolactone decarboxylase family protein [Peribacillus cavernae]MDQ0220655.1 alkylhydroperoxidase family enzyme [Peribacillus cavernae]RUQ31111.1 carboxymuconolactone decarboxylase family protein [Peribacillus cavernae]